METPISHVNVFRAAVPILNVVRMRLASMENAVHLVNAEPMPYAMLSTIKLRASARQDIMAILYRDVVHQQIHVIQIHAAWVPFANWTEEIRFAIVQRE